MKDLAARLKKAREDYGDSYRDAGKAAGVSYETIRSWEVGLVQTVPEEPLRKLARRYRTTTDYLRYGTSPPDVNVQALEDAFTMLDLVQSELGASVPPAKRSIVFRQLYERAAAGTLDRRTAEDIISLSL